MATLANAVLPSDSDPEDEDYEEAGGEEVPESRGVRGSGKKGGEGLEPLDEGRRRATEKLFAEMQAEDLEQASRRPQCPPLDALSRQFQRRHPPAVKQRSRGYVLAELAKYSNVLGAEDQAAQQPTAVELKKQVRTAAQEARAAPSRAIARPKPVSVVIEETVRFAGETVKVRQRVAKGSAEEQQILQANKRRRKAELGGQLAALDAFLGNVSGDRGVSVVQKSDLDWKAHKDEAGLEGLQRDARAGAIERKAFLARAKARGEETAREARIAARGAAMMKRAED